MRIFGFQKNVFWVGVVSLFNDFSSEMVYSVMPAFLTVVMGAPPVFVGFMEGFANALASFLKIYSGWLSDKIQKRTVLAVIGYVISTSTRWFLALVGNVWQVFLLRAIDRGGKGLRDSPRDALIAESVERHELGKSFGYHQAMDTVGAMLGPLFAAILLPAIFNNYRLLFQIAFVVGLISIISFIFIRDVKDKHVRLEPHPPFSLSLKSYSHEFKMYVLVIFIFGLGFMPVGLLLLKTQDAGLNSFFMPLMYFIYSSVFAAVSIPAGRLADRIGDKKVIAMGFLAAIAGYLILAFSSTVFYVILGFIVLGLYAAMTDGVERALVSKLVHDHKLGMGQGFLNSAIGFSSLIAGIVGGVIWTHFGSMPALLYGAVLMGIGLLTMWAHLKEPPKHL